MISYESVADNRVSWNYFFDSSVCINVDPVLMKKLHCADAEFQVIYLDFNELFQGSFIFTVIVISLVWMCPSLVLFSPPLVGFFGPVPSPFHVYIFVWWGTVTSTNPSKEASRVHSMWSCNNLTLFLILSASGFGTIFIFQSFSYPSTCHLNLLQAAASICWIPEFRMTDSS